jgi:hypothetical protein
MDNYNNLCSLKLTPYQYNIIKQIINDDKSIKNILVKIYSEYYLLTQYNAHDDYCQILYSF